MRTTIRADEYGVVTITYFDNLTQEVRTRTFTCPADGGYVWEMLPHGERRQAGVVNGKGSTLTSPSREKLIDVIRREYRKMRAAEKRKAARYRGY